MNANTPGEAAENFYDAAPLEPHLLYQGEILIDVPILNMPKSSRWLLLRTKSGLPLDEALKQGQLGGLAKVLDSNQSKEGWEKGVDGDFAMARLSKRPVLVLSQTCDIQTKQFIQVAPIFGVDDDDQSGAAGTEKEEPNAEDSTETADYVERLKADRIFSAVWIAKRPPEIQSESYADFELIQAVHRTYINRIRREQHFRLSDERVRRLQRSITRYFGRPNSYDVGADKVPADGTYLCVSCFYLDAVVTMLPFEKGAEFINCPVCNGRSWVLKGR